MSGNCYYQIALAEGKWQNSMILGQQSTAQLASILSQILANDYDQGTVVLNNILNGYYCAANGYPAGYEGLDDPGMGSDSDNNNTTQTTDNYATQEYQGIETALNNPVQAATNMVSQFAQLQSQAVSAAGGVLADMPYMSNLVSSALA